MLCTCYSKVGCDHWFIKKWMLTLEKPSLMTENKMRPQRLDTIQAEPFFPSLKKTKGRSACRAGNTSSASEHYLGPLSVLDNL